MRSSKPTILWGLMLSSSLGNIPSPVGQLANSQPTRCLAYPTATAWFSYKVKNSKRVLKLLYTEHWHTSIVVGGLWLKISYNLSIDIWHNLWNCDCYSTAHRTRFCEIWVSDCSPSLADYIHNKYPLLPYSRFRKLNNVDISIVYYYYHFAFEIKFRNIHWAG